MKLKVFIPLLSVMLLSDFFVSAKEIKGNGNVVTKEISVSDFKKIDFGKGIRRMSGKSINLIGGAKQGPVFYYSQKNGSSGLQITTDENLFSYLNVEVSGEKLVIEVKNNDRVITSQFIVNGHSDNLEEINLTNGADLDIVTTLTGSYLKANVGGGSDLRFKEFIRLDLFETYSGGGSDIYAKEMECKELIGEASGGSDLHLGGTACVATLKAGGGSDVKAYDLVVENAEVSVSGGSDLYLTAMNKLTGSASGGSDIRYKGSATCLVKTSGGSSCKKK